MRIIVMPSFAPDPLPTWARAWGDAGLDEEGRGIAVNSSGDVFVAGNDDGAIRDGLVVTFDNGGNLLGTRNNNPGLGGYWGAAVDPSGNFWAIGDSDSLDLHKFDRNGNSLFTARYGFSGTAADGFGWGMDIDSNGDPLIVGYRRAGFGGSARWGQALKVDQTTGAILWGWRPISGDSNEEPLRDATHDNSDDFCVVGYANTDPGGQGQNCIIAKLNGTTGIRQWYKRLYGLGNDYFWGVASDGTDFYAVGQTDSEGSGGVSALIVKYNGSTGAIIWRKLLGGTNDDAFHRVAVDSLGNVYAAGYTRNDGPGTLPTYSNGLVVKYDSSGNIVWQHYLGGVSIKDDILYGVTIANIFGEDKLYVTGQTGEGAGGDDILIAKLKTDGSDTGSYNAGAGQTLEYNASSLTASNSTVLTEDNATMADVNATDSIEVPDSQASFGTPSRTVTTFS